METYYVKVIYKGNLTHTKKVESTDNVTAIIDVLNGLNFSEKYEVKGIKLIGYDN